MSTGIYTSMHEEDVTDDMHLAIVKEPASEEFKANMYIDLGEPGRPVAWRYMRHDGEKYGTYGLWFRDEEEALMFMLTV